MLVTTCTLLLLQQTGGDSSTAMDATIDVQVFKNYGHDELIAVPLVKRDLGPIHGVSYQYRCEKEVSIDFKEY